MGASVGPWEFAAPMVITPPVDGVFHHLESAGRKNLAVSGDNVAIAWEDNRSGNPQVYVAFGTVGGRSFGTPIRISTGEAAYEPAIASLGDGAFIVVWEQGESVWVRTLALEHLGEPQRLAATISAQASVATDGRRAVAVWTERRGNASHIALREIAWDDAEHMLELRPAHWVDVAPPDAEQLYPTVAIQRRAITVVWEDRRHGHTLLLRAHSNDGLKFSAPQVLNEQPPQRSAIYGKGPGAARPALAAWGRNGLVAVWLDKRDFTSGYDVYAAVTDDAGRRFGRNEKVQDDFGNAISQWHAAVAADANANLAVAWDDNRDDSADIWLAWRTARGWSGDHVIPGAGGPGEQHSPTLAIDRRGGLHLAWLEQAEPNGPTSIKYVYAPRAPTAIEKPFPSSKISPSL